MSRCRTAHANVWGPLLLVVPPFHLLRPPTTSPHFIWLLFPTLICGLPSPRHFSCPFSVPPQSIRRSIVTIAHLAGVGGSTTDALVPTGAGWRGMDLVPVRCEGGGDFVKGRRRHQENEDDQSQSISSASLEGLENSSSPLETEDHVDPVMMNVTIIYTAGDAPLKGFDIFTAMVDELKQCAVVAEGKKWRFRHREFESNDALALKWGLTESPVERGGLANQIGMRGVLKHPLKVTRSLAMILQQYDTN
ncbi:hypothetical protein IW261DRAFT_1420619 [Armillaria novae-zelandiae]|uniref:Uncharacterized protein n=1 Tax=Armillaria novae-zelandiae TaxID=153914 RepID=A0AA39P548_9AGAR|nr:hypothetical protein IW261DRAFT_1420619 [Armillaria novae-zelandiae]